MDSGYYAACAGLAAQTQALELVAHNLANLATTGYRGQQATFRSLMAGRTEVALNPVNVAINNFGVLGGSRVDMSSGSLAPTGNPMDLAIAGTGFFGVQSAQGTLYTRNGNFNLTPTGQLITADGHAVLGEQGPVTVPSGAVSVSPDGTLSVDGTVVAKLRVVEFSPASNLTAVGEALYSAPKSSELDAASSSIRQGMLEGSNVSAVVGVVELIKVQRSAQMLQHALSVFDSQFNQIAVQDLSKI